MKTLLLNDTSDYHYGCKAVISTFEFEDSVKTKENIHKRDPNLNLQKYDCVVLNGEGTMHDNAINGIKFLEILKVAQKMGLRTEMVNTVWQHMSNKYDQVLKNLDNIEVRESYSQNELKMRHDVDSVVMPDRSLLVDVPYQEAQQVKIYEGQYWNGGTVLGDCPRINIFEQDWNTIVNKLRHAEVLVSGRHHEIYAAVKAETKFVIKPGNTWKNEGIFHSAGVRPIYLHQLDDVLAGKHDQDYEQIWEYIRGKLE